MKAPPLDSCPRWSTLACLGSLMCSHGRTKNRSARRSEVAVRLRVSHDDQGSRRFVCDLGARRAALESLHDVVVQPEESRRTKRP